MPAALSQLARRGRDGARGESSDCGLMSGRHNPPGEWAAFRRARRGRGDCHCCDFDGCARARRARRRRRWSWRHSGIQRLYPPNPIPRLSAPRIRNRGHRETIKGRGASGGGGRGHLRASARHPRRGRSGKWPYVMSTATPLGRDASAIVGCWDRFLPIAPGA